jgi:hypothetical protein
VSLKPELFEGMRFDFNKGINQKFSLTHSVFMGSVEARSLPGISRLPAHARRALRAGAVAGAADDKDSCLLLRVWRHPGGRADYDDWQDFH